MSVEPEVRIAELQARLLEERDEQARARIHLELARLAIGQGRMDSGVRHLREALLFDRRLQQARELLHELGEGTQIGEDPGGRRGRIRGLLGRFRRS